MTTTATFANEPGLPRVPLPSLEDSCRRFLDWCTPLLTAEERAATEKEVSAFLDGPGPKLHAALEEYNDAPGTVSWLDAFWEYRYLGRRDRIALNANFFFLFRDTGETQVQRAAGLVAGAVDHRIRVGEETLPPVVQRGQAQSMEQHRHLFSTTRIPGTEQDTVRTPYSAGNPAPADARHIVVFHRGHLFRMDVIGPDGVPHDLDDLESGLREVMRAAQEEPAACHPGPLTTAARAEWAEAREKLRAVPANAAALDQVESALFCLCLEESAAEDTKEACDRLLYGSGTGRWYDKAVSLVVFADGRAGINVEHCKQDGTTILKFVDGLLDTPPAEHARRAGARSRGVPAHAPLRFELDDELRSLVHAADEAFTAYGESTATTTVAFEDFGSDVAKGLGVSPDAFVQLAYQLAHQRAKGGVGATYESIATRQWRGGRTEAMRVVTPEIQQFTAVMEDPSAGGDAKRAAFRSAAERHVQRAKECQAGDAPEQHLWELDLIRQRRGKSLGVTGQPGLFRSPGWLTMRDDRLSTSSAPSANIEYFGFGSTSSSCIGVAYVLLPDRFHLYLSTPQSVAGQMYAFTSHLREAVAELHGLLGTEQAG